MDGERERNVVKCKKHDKSIRPIVAAFVFSLTVPKVAIKEGTCIVYVARLPT